MKIVVVGGTGLIGHKLVDKLGKLGHEVVPASPSLGINTLTKEGLSRALEGAQIVVDVANSPSFEDQAAMDFFQTSGKNLLEAEINAGVKTHVALSVVGTNRLQESGYFRAKLVQEQLIETGGIPYTIVRATQFFEFVGSIAESGIAADGSIHMPPALIQPIAADDVVDAMAAITLSAPTNGILEIAGPEKIPLDELIRKYLNLKKDPRAVTTDLDATYFGIKLTDRSLTAGPDARLGSVSFADWAKNNLHCV